tara:strand:- start:332 stop:688 length:357 start_codon:yes stop_codon:yes gene_type:complete
MKYLYLLSTLFILAACGPSEEETASEPTPPPPVNVFEGTYVGQLLGVEVIASVEGSSIYFDDDEPCVIEDPYSTTTVYNCEERSGNMIIDEDNTLTITFDDYEGFEVIYERVSESEEK